jgi:hypothetical protein
MFKQNRSNTRDKAVEIPVMNSSEIAAVWSQRAEASGSRQFFREDGSPLIGATYLPNKNIGSKFKKNRNKCRLQCCEIRRYHTLDQGGLAGLDNSPVLHDSSEEPESNDWVKVEHRSARRLRTRALYQNDYEVSIPYAMTD